MDKGTILVVEDNEINMEIATFLLQEAGFRTVPAEDAEKGIRLAYQIQPDLVLMDLHLPGKDGYNATRTLKSSPGFKDVPVIAFTALAMAEDKEKALANGCDGIIYKPIDVDSFAHTVETFIHQSKTSAFLNREISISDSQANPFSITDDQKRKIHQLMHDLKTHMVGEHTVIQVMLSGKVGPLTAKQREFLDEIMQSNQKLSTIMENWVKSYLADESENSNNQSTNQAIIRSLKEVLPP